MCLTTLFDVVPSFSCAKRCNMGKMMKLQKGWDGRGQEIGSEPFSNRRKKAELRIKDRNTCLSKQEAEKETQESFPHAQEG